METTEKFSRACYQCEDKGVMSFVHLERKDQFTFRCMACDAWKKHGWSEYIPGWRDGLKSKFKRYNDHLMDGDWKNEKKD